MKELKNEMKAVIRDLKQLTKKTERMAAKLDKLEKASKAKTVKRAPVKKTVTKKAPPKKAKKMTASDTILNIIKRRKTPIDTTTLKKVTAAPAKLPR